jgi:cold-inducible RNA-binding protein
MTKVFVGALAWATTDDSLRSRFEEFGEVVSANVIRDRETGRSKGFGFVEFAESKDAEAACEGLRDQELDGRNIRVEIASDRPPRRDREEGGGGGSWGGERRERRDYGDSRGGRFFYFILEVAVIAVIMIAEMTDEVVMIAEMTEEAVMTEDEAAMIVKSAMIAEEVAAPEEIRFLNRFSQDVTFIFHCHFLLIVAYNGT